MGQITTDQSHQILSTLSTNTDWTSIDFEGSDLQNLVVRSPKEAGRQFTTFLRNGGRMSTTGQIFVVGQAPFDPTFLGAGWRVWEDTANDPALSAGVDLSTIQLVDNCCDGFVHDSGEENLERLRDLYVLLGASFLLVLWKNKHIIPESWKEKGGKKIPGFIFFDGTILLNPNDIKCVLYLYFDGKEWQLRSLWLSRRWCFGNLSAVLGRRKMTL